MSKSLMQHLGKQNLMQATPPSPLETSLGLPTARPSSLPASHASNEAVISDAVVELTPKGRFSCPPRQQSLTVWIAPPRQIAPSNRARLARAKPSFPKGINTLSDAAPSTNVGHPASELKGDADPGSLTLAGHSPKRHSELCLLPFLLLGRLLI
jgi:hypothetical protein